MLLNVNVKFSKLKLVLDLSLGYKNNIFLCEDFINYFLFKELNIKILFQMFIVIVNQINQIYIKFGYIIYDLSN